METFQQALERRVAMEREIGYSMWAVDDKATGAFVGQCGIRPVQHDAGPEIDLAYHYVRVSWNKGYGTEAVIAVVKPPDLFRVTSPSRAEPRALSQVGVPGGSSVDVRASAV
jgi:Acetyltransferase (GNAT) domain